MLSVSNLRCERDDRILFHHLNYQFPVGQITQLEGRNGAGKSTLLRILAGLYTSYSGKVEWQNSLSEPTELDFNDQMIFIGHKSAIKLTLTPLENLRFLLGIHQKVQENDLYRALELVGLRGYEEVLCRNLSAGQHRRVALARLYLTSAKIWLLDEVFTAIDKQGVTQLEDFLSKKSKDGVCIILTTHHQLTLSNVQTLNLENYVFSGGSDE
mgnify:CR=1 FL=1